MPDQDFIADEKISIRDVLLRIQSWILYLFKKWLPITVGTILIAGVYIGYTLWRFPVYTAETTFVIAADGDQSGVSSLASAVGVNLSSIESGGTWFTTDNILELYKSYGLLKKTFLTQRDFDGDSMRLITRFIKKEKWRKKWNKEPELRDVTFEIPEEDMTQVHDSLLMVVLDKFTKRKISMGKVSRKVSIISAQTNSVDPFFAKYFNEEMVDNVNEFYIQTRTKKTLQNLNILQKQRDSIKRVIDESVLRFRDIQNRSPSPNPFLSTSSAESQRLQIDMEASAQAYKEIAGQLEVAKIEHMNNTPLIQIIDRPVMPLEDDKPRTLKLVVIAFFMGGFIMVSYFTGMQLYGYIMRDS